MSGKFSAPWMLACIALLAGCGATPEKRAYEYMPDMARGPAYKAYAPNFITRDGLTLQRPVAGTIPRGFHPFHYGPGEAEAIRAGRELENPYRAAPQTLEEGKELFRAFLGRQVNKRKLCSKRINSGAELFDFAYSFAAECATEVAQENQQQRTVLRQSRDVTAVLRQTGRRNLRQ